MLGPFSLLYALISRVHFFVRSIRATRCTFPVLSVGNVVVGGSGKTPVTIALAELLRENGKNPIIVTRGYGGDIFKNAGVTSGRFSRWFCLSFYKSIKPNEKSAATPEKSTMVVNGAVLVDEKIHSAREVGDEAMVLCKHASTVVAKDRRLGIDLVNSLEFPENTAVILDDAHQNSSIKKDVSIIVVNSKQMFGNGFVIPSGPLRERISSGIARADLVVFVYDDEREKNRARELCKYGRPIIFARSSFYVDIMRGARVVAFAGIGFADRFFDTLCALGLEVVKFIRFEDHHEYDVRNEKCLLQLARSNDAFLVSTRKDYVKFSSLFCKQVHVVDLFISFSGSVLTPAGEEIYVGTSGVVKFFT